MLVSMIRIPEVITHDAVNVVRMELGLTSASYSLACYVQGYVCFYFDKIQEQLL